ncbi:MAG: hypothetical protein PHD76_10565 [Methylacidiphilales bacterium]|nr:hypothetical protein [Candidatus Methylacidiphilales bacterium]
MKNTEKWVCLAALAILSATAARADTINSGVYIGNLSIQPDTGANPVEAGDLTLSGALDVFGNTLNLGTAGSSPGISFTYTDDATGQTTTINLAGARNSTTWRWQQNSSGGMKDKMKLDQNNVLTIQAPDYSGGNAGKIVLTPNTSGSQITIDGNALLTASAAAGIYLTQSAADQRYTLANSIWAASGSNGIVTSDSVGIGTSNPNPNTALTVSGGAAGTALQLYARSTDGQSTPVFSVGDAIVPNRNWIDSYGIMRVGTGLVVGSNTFNDPNVGTTFPVGLYVVGGSCSMFVYGTDSSDDRAMMRFRSKNSALMYMGVKYNSGMTQCGFFNQNGDSNNPLMVINNGNAGNSGGQVGIGTGNPAAQLQINVANPTYIGQIVKGAASQTANLTQWQNSSGTVLAKIDANGNFTTNGNATVTGSMAVQGPITAAPGGNIPMFTGN